MSSRAFIALLSGAVVLLPTTCGIFRADSPVGEQPVPTASAPALQPPLAIGAKYRSAVVLAVATDLGLTSAQIRTDLLDHPDSTLMNLAKPRGLAQDQLAGRIRTALTAATAQQVRSAVWTHAQAAQLNQFGASQADPSLISQVSQWFRVGG
jgi:hypothetical protein